MVNIKLVVINVRIVMMDALSVRMIQGIVQSVMIPVSIFWIINQGVCSFAILRQLLSFIIYHQLNVYVYYYVQQNQQRNHQMEPTVSLLVLLTNTLKL